MAVNTRKLAQMVRAKRGDRGLRAVANEIGGVSASTLSRIEQENVPDLATFLRLCSWLGASQEEFIDEKPNHPEPSTLDWIVVRLRADPTLSPETADALARVFELAYTAARQNEK